ncbi:MAG: TIGR03621 family F420-dependent LLM class oxidoreductase [Candidatus Thorarchaeota archaeon]
MKSIRFGVLMRTMSTRGHYPSDDWVEKVQNLEKLGYSSLLISDHFNNQWEPIATAAAVASVTRQLKVGPLVMCVDFRPPVVLAQAAATLHLISKGRCEFGFGAGWTKAEYDQAGIQFDSPAVRINRLEETLVAVRQMWTEEKSSYSGNHIHLSGIGWPTQLPEGERPKITVGGGGRKLLSMAGRHADIVSIVPSWPKGRIVEKSTSDQTSSMIRKKAEWVKASAESAGRDPSEIELSTVHWQMRMTDSRDEALKEYAKMYGISFDVLTNTPFFLVGTPEDIREEIINLNELTGISYFVVPGSMDDFKNLEQFSSLVIRPITGN